MTRRQYAGGAVRTTTTGTIASSGGGTVTISSSTGWPDGSVGKFAVIVDPGLSSEEKILVDSRTGTTLTYSSGGRSYDGSTAQAHSSGATIWVCFTSVDLDEANAHINASAAAHAGSAISFTPTGNIAATTVQAAIAEVDSETDARLDTIEAAGWVTTARITDANVTAAKLATNAVATANIVDANVTTAKLADASVTFAKLAAIDVSRWTRVAAQTIGTTTEAAISWTAETEDDLSLAVPTFTVITLPSGADGVWAVDLRFTNSNDLNLGSSQGYVQAKVNGTYLYRHQSDFPAATWGFTWTLVLAAGDTLEIDIYNASNTTTSDITNAALKLARIGKVA